MPEWIKADTGLGKEDPGLEFMRRHYPERYAARTTPHPFVHMVRDPRDKCPPEGAAKCVCDTCWEPKSRKVHR